MLTDDKFRAYLEDRWKAYVEGEGNVPCGECRGCCRAGYAIGLSHEEAKTIAHSVIDGHPVILPLPNGYCPNLIDERCSIYATRPVSCRQFDCRDFAMASVRINAEGRAGVEEINRSIERAYEDNGKLTPVTVAKRAADLVGRGTTAVAAVQNVVVLSIIEQLPKAKGQKLIHTLLSPAEEQRGAAMEAAHNEVMRILGGQPS